MTEFKGYDKKQLEALKGKLAANKTRGKADRLKGNVTYYNVRAMEAYERGDYDMASDYTELVKRNLERLAAL